MKNTKTAKILVAVLSAALILGAAFAFSAYASEAPEIVSKNVSYEGALHLYYAIPATDTVKADNTVVNVYATNPDTDANAQLIGSYSGKLEHIDVLDGDYIVVRTQGIPAKDIAKYVYAQPVSGDVAGKVYRYSVAEYLYERLYVSENSSDLQKKLYNTTLQYGIDAQAVLDADATPIANYNYVYAYDATLDAEGNNSGLYLDGESVSLTYTGEETLTGWNLKTLGENGVFADGVLEGNVLNVDATTLITPSSEVIEIVKRENNGETFDAAFKDSARENIDLPDTNKTYYNNYIFAEKASANVNSVMSFGVVKDPTDPTNNVLHIKKDNTDSATTYQSYLTFTAPSTNNFDTVVFETDLYNDFSDKSTSTVNQFDFRNGSTEGVTVLVGNSYDNLTIRINGASGGVSGTAYEVVEGVLAENSWYTLRIEYQILDASKGETETRVYVNGKHFKTVNYVNTMTPLTNVTNMIVRTYGGVMGDLYMDNVTIKKVYAADEARPAYTFDGDTLPEGKVTIGGWGSGTKGTATVNNGQLVLNSVQGYNDTVNFFESQAAEENANTVVWSADIKPTALAAFANGSYSELSFNGTEGGNFRFNIMLRNSIGQFIYFKSYARNPKLELATTPTVYSGDIFNLRLEYYVAADGMGRVDIYLNNNLMGTMDDPKEGSPSVDAVNRFVFSCRDGDTQNIIFDNVRLYKINKTR